MKRAHLLAFSLALACEQTAETSGPPSRSFLPMVALDNSVAFVDSSSGTTFLLDPADPALKPRIVATGQSPVKGGAVPHKGANQLLVLTKGVQGDVDVEPEPARLVVVDPASSAAVASYDLPGRYDSMAQSDDGAFAVLYYSESSQASGSMLFNPNDMAVVTFATGTVQTRPIRSLGGAPFDVKFSPPGATLFGQPRNLAMIWAVNYVTLLDLDHGDRSEITIPLSPDGKGSLKPAQVVFDLERQALYVRATGSKDIFQISLDPAAPLTADENDFRASVSLLGSGSEASDVQAFGTGDKMRLAATTSDSKPLVILNPATGSATSVATGVPVNQIFVFNGPSPKSPAIEARALLAGVGTNGLTLVFADLEEVETKQGLALENWALPHPVAQITLLSGGFALLTHSATYSGGTSFSIVNLADRTIEPIGSSGTFNLATTEVAAPSRLWGTNGADRIEYLDLADHGRGRLFAGEVILDQTIKSISPLAQPSADGIRYLVLGMDDPTDAKSVGYVTVLNADQPDRKGARSAYGFFLTDYLERGTP